MSWLQVASTSRGSTGAPPNRGGVAVRNSRTASDVPERRPTNSAPRLRENEGTTEESVEVLALREGQALPEGYRYVVRGDAASTTPREGLETVDLTTPPDAQLKVAGVDEDVAKRRAAERRNETRSGNKRALAAFAKEAKESLAGGRPPVINVSENHTHLKARWHSAAKEAAYKILDMRKEGWKSYTHNEKEKVHREMKLLYKVEPPIDPRQVDKYLAGHLRSARAVWKAHWLIHGDDGRHPNAPTDAWEVLCEWWKTDSCKEVSAEMASRRALVQNTSKTGRKRLEDRMDEQVRFRTHDLYCPLVLIVRVVCAGWEKEGGHYRPRSM